MNGNKNYRMWKQFKEEKKVLHTRGLKSCCIKYNMKIWWRFCLKSLFYRNFEGTFKPQLCASKSVEQFVEEPDVGVMLRCFGQTNVLISNKSSLINIFISCLCRYRKRKRPGDHWVLLSAQDCGGWNGRRGQSLLNKRRTYMRYLLNSCDSV